MSRGLVGVSSLARRMLAGPRGAMLLRGGGGGPIPGGPGRVPTEPLPEEEELIWDDGTNNKERCLDEFTLVSTNTARLWLAGALSCFGVVGLLARLDDKASKVPYAPKEFPYDNLKAELGRA